MKKFATALLIIFATALAGIIFYFKGKEYVIRVPEDELRQIMEEKLPLTKTYFFIISVTLSNPRVDLIEGSDQINAGLDVTLNIGLADVKGDLGGEVDLSGGVNYIPETGEFFLVDPVVEHLSIQGLSEEPTEKANKAVSIALAERFESHPIYRLRASDVNTAAAKLLLKSVVVENEELVITLGF